MDVVKEVLRIIKTGQRKDGKGEWQLQEVELNSGKKATGFGLEAGDTVIVTYNEEYKNYNAKKVTKLDVLEQRIDALEKAVSELTGPQKAELGDFND